MSEENFEKSMKFRNNVRTSLRLVAREDLKDMFMAKSISARCDGYSTASGRAHPPLLLTRIRLCERQGKRQQAQFFS